MHAHWNHTLFAGYSYHNLYDLVTVAMPFSGLVVADAGG
jgi:hypothetical protein